MSVLLVSHKHSHKKTRNNSLTLFISPGLEDLKARLVWLVIFGQIQYKLRKIGVLLKLLQCQCYWSHTNTLIKKLETISLTLFISLGLEHVQDLKAHLVWLVLFGQI